MTPHPRQSLARSGIPLFLILVALAAGPLLADTIVLKNGNRFEGHVTSETPTHIILQTDQGEIVFKRAEVLEIVSAPWTPRKADGDSLEKRNQARPDPKTGRRPEPPAKPATEPRRESDTPKKPAAPPKPQPKRPELKKPEPKKPLPKVDAPPNEGETPPEPDPAPAPPRRRPGIN